MNVRETYLPGVLLIEPQVFKDQRGHFLEAYHAERYRAAGIPATFVQSNQSHSRKDVLRGLHYQLGKPQAKLVRVVHGEVFDVAVDIRRGSPTFSQWISHTLSDDNNHQLYIPQGFAHGFYVLSETAIFLYECTDYYAPKEERGIRWDDPDLAISWPKGEKNLSQKDQSYPVLRDINEDLPIYPAK
jgi:dTDP-4-dehydrorhamnose 3,5-epimerase